jgi:3-hydroxyacyl-[acyl-carrier-protein] dehydratase
MQTLRISAQTLRIPADHPAFAGHFPGLPILPGALLLDTALAAIESDLNIELVEWLVASAKFLEPVRPGDVLTVEHSRTTDTIRFAVRVAERAALSGSLSRLPAGGVDDA